MLPEEEDSSEPSTAAIRMCYQNLSKLWRILRVGLEKRITDNKFLDQDAPRAREIGKMHRTSKTQRSSISR